MRESRFARARDQLEEVLRAEPENAEALEMMGDVYRSAEGSIPRAYHCYERVVAILERRPHPEEDENVRDMYARVLYQLGAMAAQLDRPDEALGWMDKRDRLYKTRLNSERGWLLIEMRRFEEARRMMEGLKNSSDRSTALHNLAAIEFELGHPQASYDLNRQLNEESGDNDPASVSNFAEAALNLLLFDESEKLSLRASRIYYQDSYANPWSDLARLYTIEGRLPEAVDALKRMQAWRLSNSAQLSQHDWAACYGRVGLVLLQLGYPEKACDVFARLARRQDRRHGISTPAELLEAALLFLYAESLQQVCQRLRERLSYCSWSQSPALLAELWHKERQLTRERQRVANLITSSTGLAGFMQPYGPRSSQVSFLGPALWAYFGPAATIQTAEQNLNDPQPDLQRRGPYFLAVRGEAEFYDWQAAAAEKDLRQALELLPQAEVTLRRRCQAVLAKLLLQQNRLAESLPLIQTLLESDPSQLRAVRCRLPLSIESDGSGVAGQARRWLYASPRCLRAQGAFTLKLTASQGRLFSPDGTELHAFSGKTAADLCRSFHDEVFAPVLDLNQADINSINGSTRAARPSEFLEGGKLDSGP